MKLLTNRAIKMKVVFMSVLMLVFQYSGNAQAKVLILGIDGCRPDALQEANTPNLDALWQNGAYSFSAQTDPISSSGICWTSMLTGVWHEKHNVVSNEYRNPNLGEYPHFFRRVKEQRPELKTFSVVNWGPIHKILQDGDADISNYLTTDEKVTARVVELLSTENPDVFFIQLDDVDHAGHEFDFNPGSKEYIAAIQTADAQTGKILQALKNRENYARENWLVLVSTDHGGSNFSHGKDIPEHTTVFYMAGGATVKPGELNEPVNVVDVAVTAMKHLGIDIKESWNLDGKVAGL